MTATNFFTQSVTISQHQGQNDRYGNKTFTTSSTISCKFVVKQGLEKDATGEEYTYDAICYVPLDQEVDMKDKYTYDDSVYKIAHIVEQRGTVTNLKHKKLMLQRQDV